MLFSSTETTWRSPADCVSPSEGGLSSSQNAQPSVPGCQCPWSNSPPEEQSCMEHPSLLIPQGDTADVLSQVNKTNTYLSGVLPSVLVFPITNGGVILATTLLSVLFFKEKLSLLQKIGLVIGILGIFSITIGKAIA